MAGSRYADRACSDCGKKIPLQRQKHDKDKLPADRATLWSDFQRQFATRCLRCAHNVRVRKMKEIEARYDMSGIEE